MESDPGRRSGTANLAALLRVSGGGSSGATGGYSLVLVATGEVPEAGGSIHLFAFAEPKSPFLCGRLLVEAAGSSRALSVDPLTTWQQGESRDYFAETESCTMYGNQRRDMPSSLPHSITGTSQRPHFPPWDSVAQRHEE